MLSMSIMINKEGNGKNLFMPFAPQRVERKTAQEKEAQKQLPLKEDVANPYG